MTQSLPIHPTCLPTYQSVHTQPDPVTCQSTHLHTHPACLPIYQSVHTQSGPDQSMYSFNHPSTHLLNSQFAQPTQPSTQCHPFHPPTHSTTTHLSIRSPIHTTRHLATHPWPKPSIHSTHPPTHSVTIFHPSAHPPMQPATYPLIHGPNRPSISPTHPPVDSIYSIPIVVFFIAGSPWKVQVIDPQSIRVSSSGREIVPVNAPASFSIKCGSSPADQVTISVKGIVAGEGGCLVPCLCVHHRPQVWLGHSPGHCPCFTTRLLPFAPTEVQLVGFLAL